MSRQTYVYRTRDAALPAGPEAIEHLMENVDRSILPQLGNIEAIKNLALWAFYNAPIEQRLQIMADSKFGAERVVEPSGGGKAKYVPQQEWNIFNGLCLVDTAFFAATMGAADVRDSLVAVDGYPKDIHVKKVPEDPDA